MWPFDIFKTSVKHSFKYVKKDMNSTKAWLSWLFAGQRKLEERLDILEKRMWELEAEGMLKARR